VHVSIEVPHGAVVETLLERGFTVFAINPKQLDRFRDRHTVAGAKDDRRDAFVIADSLRHDLSLYRRVKLGDPLLVELRELTRMHEDLGGEMVALGNRLRDQLQRFYPQLVSLGSVHEERWLWALLKRAPTPEEGGRLSLAKIESILKKHRIRRVSAVEVRDVLRREPLRAAPGVREASTRHVQQLLPRLELADEQRRESLAAMEKLLDRIDDEGERKEHRDARILRSLPGVGTIVCATMLAEAWEPLADRDYRRLRANCGVAPVTKQSGKSMHVTRRRACNRRLVEAVFHWAANAVRRDPKAREHYRRLRAAGHSHGRALRGVADRLLAVLTAMLKRDVTYDPKLRLAA
jgi:transposase